MMMREPLNPFSKRNKLLPRLKKDPRLAKRRTKNPSKRTMPTQETSTMSLEPSLKAREREEVEGTTVAEGNTEAEVKGEDEENTEEEEVKAEAEAVPDHKLREVKLKELTNSKVREGLGNIEAEGAIEEIEVAEESIEAEVRAEVAEAEAEEEGTDHPERETTTTSTRRLMRELKSPTTREKPEEKNILITTRSMKVIQDLSMAMTESQELAEAEVLPRVELEPMVGVLLRTMSSMWEMLLRKSKLKSRRSMLKLKR
jgi:hypothetical protein